jgi:hypothetical protein
MWSPSYYGYFFFDIYLLLENVGVDPSKNSSGLQYEFHLKPYMLIELCASNYCTNDGLVNGVGRIF